MIISSSSLLLLLFLIWFLCLLQQQQQQQQYFNTWNPIQTNKQTLMSIDCQQQQQQHWSPWTFFSLYNLNRHTLIESGCDDDDCDFLWVSYRLVFVQTTTIKLIFQTNFWIFHFPFKLQLHFNQSAQFQSQSTSTC